VLDGTDNSKLSELAQTFREHGGSAYIGEDAWAHLEAEAGPTMSVFIDKYIRGPFDDLLEQTPTDIPELRVRLRSDSIYVQIGAETLDIKRDEPITPNESLF